MFAIDYSSLYPNICISFNYNEIKYEKEIIANEIDEGEIENRNIIYSFDFEENIDNSYKINSKTEDCHNKNEINNKMELNNIEFK